MARTESITVRITEAGSKAIDSLRGGWSRSEYVRAAVADWVKRDKRGPEKRADL